MLQHHFYTVDSLTTDGLKEKENIHSGHVMVTLNGNHEVFAGHFPDHPVVPGVFTLQMIKECLQSIVKKKLQYKEMKNCKFTHFIFPDNGPVSIELEYDDPEEIRLRAKVNQGGVVCLLLNAKLIESQVTK